MKGLAVIASTGTAWKRVIPALRGSSVVKVIAVHGRNPRRLAALAEQEQIQLVYTSVPELLRCDEIDFVFIASPPFLHLEHVAAAAAAGKPIICEKPLSTNLGSAREIAKIVSETGVPFMLAHQLRHHPALQRVAELLRGRRIGDVRHAEMQWSFSLDLQARNVAWKQDPAFRGPTVFHDAGIHAIDVALWLFGRPASVFARKVPSTGGPRDSAAALLSYSTLTASVSSSHDMTAPLNALRVDGRDGHIFLPHAFSDRGPSCLRIVERTRSELEEFDEVDPYRAEIEAFARALGTGAPAPEPSLETALLGSSVLAAIDRSMKMNALIDVSECLTMH